MPKVFISSTSEDLKEHRQAVRDAALMSGFEPVMMEYFNAQGGRPPFKACMEIVEGCDVVVAIVAHRYGWIPPDQPGPKVRRTRSITWLECLKARNRKPPLEVLPFVLAEKASWPAEFRDSVRLERGAPAREVTRDVAQLRQFKEWLGGLGFRVEFTDAKDLKAGVLGALNEWRQRQAGAAAQTQAYQDPEIERLRHLSDTGGAKQALLDLRKLVVSRLGRLDTRKAAPREGVPPIEVVRRFVGSGRVPIAAIEQLEYAVSVSSQGLYDGEVPAGAARSALEAAEKGLAAVARLLPSEPAFHMEARKNGTYGFAFRAGGETLLTSESYQSLAAARNGVWSTRKNVEGRIHLKEAKDGRPFFSVVAANGEIVATSVLFDSTAQRNRAVRMVQETVPMAPLFG